MAPVRKGIEAGASGFHFAENFFGVPEKLLARLREEHAFARTIDEAAADFLLHWVNFLTPPIEAMRAVVFYGHLPGAGDAIYTVVAAGVALALGALVFSRSDDRIATEV